MPVSKIEILERWKTKFVVSGLRVSLLLGSMVSRGHALRSRAAVNDGDTVRLSPRFWIFSADDGGSCIWKKNMGNIRTHRSTTYNRSPYDCRTMGQEVPVSVGLYLNKQKKVRTLYIRSAAPSLEHALVVPSSFKFESDGRRGPLASSLRGRPVYRSLTDFEFYTHVPDSCFIPSSLLHVLCTMHPHARSSAAVSLHNYNEVHVPHPDLPPQRHFQDRSPLLRVLGIPKTFSETASSRVHTQDVLVDQISGQIHMEV